MSATHCARCGRLRPPSVPGSADSLISSPLPPEQVAVWAFISGQDVCPPCQTPEEREEATKRLLSAIQREIVRRQDEAIPPDEHEGPLIGYAMDVGARADAAEAPVSAYGDAATDGDDVGSAPAESRVASDANLDDRGAAPAPDPDSLRQRHSAEDLLRLRVAVTGAFLTGHALAVGIDRYDALQTELGGRLKAPMWRTHGLHAQGGTYRTAGGGGFTEAIPLVIARRQGADLLPWLSAALGESKRPGGIGADRFASALDATPNQLVIDVYDLGVAVMTASLDVTAPEGTDLEIIAGALKRLVWLGPDDGGRSPLAEVLQEIALAVTREYGDAVLATASEQLQAAKWRSVEAPGTSESVPDLLQGEYGRLLWLHPVHILRLPEAAEWGTSEKALMKLAPAFHETVKLEVAVFAPGIGASAVVVNKESDAEDAPIRLTELHWAYYSFHIGIDRNLLGVLNQQRWNQSYPLKHLEADAERVFADYRRIVDARARLESHLTALGGDELAMWDTIAKVQRFDALLTAVDRKLEVLEKLAERRVVLAAAERNRRIANVLGFLSALTLVSVTAGLVGVLLGASTSGWDPWWLSAAVIVVAVLAAIMLYLRGLRHGNP